MSGTATKKLGFCGPRQGVRHVSVTCQNFQYQFWSPALYSVVFVLMQILEYEAVRGCGGLANRVWLVAENERLGGP